MADQRLAGALVAVATVAVLVVAVLLGVRRRTHRGTAEASQPPGGQSVSSVRPNRSEACTEP